MWLVTDRELKGLDVGQSVKPHLRPCGGSHAKLDEA